MGDLSYTYPQTAADIAMQDSLKMIANVPYEVTHFKLITARKKAPAQMWSFNSNRLSASCKAALANLASGDRIIIEAIKAELTLGGTTHKANLSPIMYDVR